MMNREDTLIYIHSLQFVENYVKKLMYKEDDYLYDDYVSECYLQICELSEEKIKDLWTQGTKNDNAKALRGFISGLIYRNVKSTNSRAYYKLKRFTLKEVPTSMLSEGDKCFEKEDDDEQ